MPRKKLIKSPVDPYHVTARCINKDWFRLPTPLVWQIFSNYLYFISHAFNVRVISFVLMNNHFHLLILTPDANLDVTMNYFMREVSRSITKQSGRINQTFGGPYHWCIIKNYTYLLNAYRYVYQNPVAAKLSSTCENYSFSSLHRLIGKDHLGFPCHDNNLIDDLEYTLQWLNKIYGQEQRELIESALRKTTFRFPKNNSTGKERQLT